MPGGELLLAFHLGVETVDVEDWWGTGAQLRFFFHDPERVHAALERIGFQEIDVATRAPYAESVESQTERAYIRARRKETP